MRVATNGNFGPVRIPPIPTCLPGPVRQQLRAIRDEAPPMSDTAFRQLVDLLTEQHGETLKKVNALELSMGTIKGQVDVLMGAHTDRVVDRKQDMRKVKDVVLQIAVVLLLSGLLTLGVQYVKGTNTPQPQAQQDAGTAAKINELIEEIRTDRAARESETPSQTIKVPQRNKPRRAPEPQRLNRLREGDMITNTNMDLPIFGYNHIPLPMMERPK